MKMEPIVIPKRRQIELRRRGITQKGINYIAIISTLENSPLLEVQPSSSTSSLVTKDSMRLKLRKPLTENRTVLSNRTFRHCLRTSKMTPKEGLRNGQVNLLTPNDDYSGRNAPLTSKCCILYIYSTNVGMNNLNMVYILRLFLFKMQFVS